MSDITFWQASRKAISLSREVAVKIDVRKEFGEDCIALEDGERLFEVIHPALAAGDAVTLDFSGVAVFSTPFLNAAVGQLFADLTATELQRLLLVTGLSAEGRDTLRRVVDNSKAYYSDPRRRSAVERLSDAGDDR